MPPAAPPAAPPRGLAEVELDFVFDGAAASAEATQRSSGHAARGGGAALELQARLAKARSTGLVLEVVEVNLETLDALHAATALHRLARYSRGQPGEAETVAFARDPVRASLLERLNVEGALEELSAQGRCCVLWALARLGVAPPWLPRLLRLCAESAPSLSAHQLATALHALSRLRAPPEDPQLLEALHRELRRRQGSLGPGGTSAMDTVLLADALARLRVHDEELFAALAGALRAHLRAGQLRISDVRRSITAFAMVGFVDVPLSSEACAWLLPRLADCRGADLVALAGALSRAGPLGKARDEFFAALAREVSQRLRSVEFGARDAAGLVSALSQAGAPFPELSLELIAVAARAPRELNGEDLALMAPCFGQAAGRRPDLLEGLAVRAAGCAATLSPRQLARLICGFSDAGVCGPLLWEALSRESLVRAAYFSAPDIVRALAGLHASGAAQPEVLRAFWARAAEKSEKLLAEEALVLLKLWSQQPAALQRERAALPESLLQNLRRRLGHRWQAPPDLAADLLEWLPASRSLLPRGKLDARLLHAALRQLPRQLLAATPEVWQRLLALLAADGEILVRTRVELEQQEPLRGAFSERLALAPSGTADPSLPYDVGASRSTAFLCAALGFDGPPLRELLRALLQDAQGETDDIPRAAQLCWACAEVGVSRQAAQDLASRLAQRCSLRDEPPGGGDNAAADPVSWIRLAWAWLALGGSDSELQLLLRTVAEVDGPHLLTRLTPADLRPAQQLAWHSQYWHRGVAAGRWMQAERRRERERE